MPSSATSTVGTARPFTWLRRTIPRLRLWRCVGDLRFARTALYSHVVATRTVAHVADLAASEDYVERHPAAVAAVELGGVRTALLYHAEGG